MNLFLKFIKFGLVGGIGMCIDFGVTYMLKEKLKLNKYFANGCGFTLAVINNFILNKFWTFNSSQNSLWKVELLKFVLFAIIGLGINTLLLFLFHDKLGVRFYIAKGLSIVCVFIWNFSTNFLFNFH